jgi:hypothetical protein
MTFDLIENRHRVAVWAAARATSRGVGGLSVRQALDWVERLGLRTLLAGHANLPPAAGFDDQHRGWRTNLISYAGEAHKNLSHGGAAKLINVYLKVAVVCASCENDGATPFAARERLGAIHPPIDRLLLLALAARQGRSPLAARFRKLQAWSRLSSDEYQEIIDGIRALLPSSPTELWRIEEFWPVTSDGADA